ncbi:MAG TPA: NusG domain II-containing protein [Nitrospirae bacterium]|nr:NusG domain II-containing protein [Nitrospirota bacterium]
MQEAKLSLLKETLKEITIYDWALLVALILLSVSGLFLVKGLALSGNTASIEVNGKLLYRLSLNEDRTVEVHGPIGITRVEVKQGKIRITDSPCPNKLCIRQGWIKRGAIICLPNRVVVTIGGDDTGEVDAISG